MGKAPEVGRSRASLPGANPIHRSLPFLTLGAIREAQ